MMRLQCKYHPGENLISDYQAGDLVCSVCGLVCAERVIDTTSEWRTFANDSGAKDMSRVGHAENYLLSGSQVSTKIAAGTSAKHFDESGKPKYTNSSSRTINSSDRTLIQNFSEISQIGARLNLPKNITDKANETFKKVFESGKLRGRSNDAVSASCLYLECRRSKVPRTFKEVCAACKVDKKNIGKVFKKILAILEADIKTVSVEDFMERFCANLHLNTNMAVRNLANEISRRASTLNLVHGRSPVSVAAACIYMASHALGVGKDKRDISDIAGVAEGTLSSAYKLMRPRARDLIPSSTELKVAVAHLPF